ncbi:uncharacterized protein RHOBADRAFT_55715 [Rhodotorula graminis WP1]|uniref:Potassium channel domain-containing protein n=1 Tax=Rhodotorula graminis (strain WP1) TaxID=578459 RepID=A0A0P9EZG7_RHOGW|nr:uncharacterized protein RHOBADRAFT_55715 [Rhodotorula graminis WP1]KPV72618.1 hypothetical protein RHOBADRAFT_55715 [Rhodotorula graminis WP1]
MSAATAPPRSPSVAVDAFHRPRPAPASGPSSSSESGASAIDKVESQHGTDNEELDEHAAEQAEIEAAVDELRERREQDKEAVGARKGVSGFVARWMIRRRHRRAAAAAAKSDGDGEDPDDSLALPPDTRLLPIISGLACPFAVLLDIPGLTTPWYIKTQGDLIVDSQPNPVLLDVEQAVALALGVLANAALIWRFLEHSPRRTTWVAMISLTIRDAIAIAACVWFLVVHRFNDGFVYGDGLWLSLAAVVASLTCNITLGLDLWRTENFDKKGSGLTEKQRALVIVAMSFLLNLGLGSLAYSYLIPDLRFIDAMYFTECILTTVGFGDILPKSVGARIFTLFYTPLGIINLAVVVAVARETIIESFERSYRSRRDRLAQKARERKAAILKKQELARHRARRAAEDELLRQGPAGPAPSSLNFVPPSGRSALVAGLGATMPVIGAMAGKETARSQLPTLDALERVESAASRSRLAQALVRPVHVAGRYVAKYIPRRRKVEHDCEAATEPGPGNLQRTSTAGSTITTTSIDRSFVSLRNSLRREQRQEFRVKLAVALSVFLTFWLAGAGIYSVTEDGWSFWIGIWFSAEYFTTLGLGDYTPTSPAGRAFFVAWSIFGIASMTLLLSVLTESWSARYKSSLTDGRFKKAYRRVKGNKDGRRGESAQGISSRLLSKDGFEPLSRDGEGLPDKIVRVLKGFHSHARYFMLGRNGHPPSELSALFAAAEDAPDGVDQLIQRGAASLAEASSQGDTEHFLFLVSYERQFDLLLESAEQLATVVSDAAARMSHLEAENARLKEQLAGVRGAQSGEGSSMFQRRPAGGFGDEEVEEELCEEVDKGTDPLDDEVASAAAAKPGAATTPRLHLPHPRLRPTSSPHPASTPAAPQSPAAPVPASASPPPRSRTPSVAFASPSSPAPADTSTTSSSSHLSPSSPPSIDPSG